MSRRVIDDKVITGHVTEEDLKELYDFNPVSQEDPASLSRPEVPLIANLPFAIANRIGTVLKHEDFFYIFQISIPRLAVKICDVDWKRHKSVCAELAAIVYPI